MERTSLAALEVLVAVDEQGSISAAARALGVAQPTVSAAVRRLERRLRLPLVDRSSHGAHLTEPGRAVAAWARDLLESSREFERSVTALHADGVCRLVVAASMTIAETLVPEWLTLWRRFAGDSRVGDGLSATRPTVELLVRNSEGVMREVLDGTADLGFVEGVGVRSGLRDVVLAEDELLVVVAPRHPWAQPGVVVAPADLPEAPLVLREKGSGTREVLERALADAGLHLPDDKPQLGSTAAVKTAVQQGDVVGVVSALAVRGELRRGSLVRVRSRDLDLRRSLRMVTRSRGEPSVSARELASVILAAAVSDPATDLKT